MTSTIRDGNTAKQMGDNGRQTVETSFSVEKMVSGTEAIYYKELTQQLKPKRTMH